MGSLGSILRLQLLLGIGSPFWMLASADKRILLEPGYSLHERPPTQEREPLLIQVSYRLKMQRTDSCSTLRRASTFATSSRCGRRSSWSALKPHSGFIGRSHVVQVFSPCFMYVLLIHILLDTFLQQIIQYKFQDTRLRPDSKYLESADSFGEYVALNPSKADIIWMPDIFIDQVNCILCWTYQKQQKISITIKILQIIFKSSNRCKNA